MKAVLCKTYGPPSALVVEDIATPVPGPGEVRVAVHAAGVNFPDTLIIQGKYQFKPDLPFSPGAEVAGTIDAIGEGVTGWSVGDRVIAATTWGGYAQAVCAQASRVVPIPEGVDFQTAAGFVLAYGTSYHALKDRGELKAGETVLVLGAAGGVGLAAVEIAKAMGARVIAAASSPDKLQICRQHGADATIDYSRENLRERIKSLTDGRGVDVVYDPVGGALSEPALRAMAWRGRFLVVGFAAGAIPSVALNLTLLKGCSIVGVFWGAYVRNEPERNKADLAELAAWLREGRLRPRISGVFPMERCAEALQQVIDRQVTGKLVLTTHD